MYKQTKYIGDWETSQKAYINLALVVLQLRGVKNLMQNIVTILNKRKQISEAGIEMQYICSWVFYVYTDKIDVKYGQVI